MTAQGPERAIRVVHVITGLDVGGAEMMLCKLMRATNRSRIDPTVISLSSLGAIGSRIQEAGVEVRALQMRSSSALPGAMVRLTGWLRELRPDVVQTWMYHADLLGGVAARLAGCRRVVWGLRQSSVSVDLLGPRTHRLVRVCAALSGTIPSRIVACSETTRKAHAAFGYSVRHMVVVPNGFEIERFHPDPQARAAVRGELGIGDSTPLVGLFSRFNIYKDHGTFCAAAAVLRQTIPAVHFVLCGDQVLPENNAFRTWQERYGLNDGFHLLGPRDDVPRLMAAVDIAASSSVSEGFPNVIGEAMACGTPCVVTDAGDSAAIIGETGCVVPVQEPAALSAAMAALLGEGKEALAARGAAARARIVTCFSIGAVSKLYETLYCEMARGVANQRN